MQPALDIDNLEFVYPGADRPTFSAVSLRVSAREQVLIKGASGSGKSTLLYTVAGLTRGAKGTVRVAGQDVLTMSPGARDRWRGAHLGLIFQTFNLLQGFSALENVLAALKFSSRPRREHAPRARELLARLGVDRVEATPDELSVGQQQRVAVARAVACEPALVLADEPTASLDPENAAAALDLIQGVCRERGAALVCTSHDPAVASRFERVIELSSSGIRGAVAARA